LKVCFKNLAGKMWKPGEERKYEIKEKVVSNKTVVH
jgi:hypothetical protein